MSDQRKENLSRLEAAERIVDMVEDFRNQMRVQALEYMMLPAEYDTLMEELAAYRRKFNLSRGSDHAQRPT